VYLSQLQTHEPLIFCQNFVCIHSVMTLEIRISWLWIQRCCTWNKLIGILIWAFLCTVIVLDVKRRLLHRLLALPQDRPYFRRGNAYLFADDIPVSAPLINVHEGLTPTGKTQ